MAKFTVTQRVLLSFDNTEFNDIEIRLDEEKEVLIIKQDGDTIMIPTENPSTVLEAIKAGFNNGGK